MDSTLPLEENDTIWLFKQLVSAKKEENIYFFISQLKGPFSIVFFSRPLRKLYFCRDRFGRSSLLMNRKNNFNYVIASVLDKSATYSAEIPPVGIYSIEIETLNITLKPWFDLNSREFHKMKINRFEKTLNITLTIGSILQVEWCERLNLKIFRLFYQEPPNFDDINLFQNNFDDTKLPCQNLIKFLKQSVKERVMTTQKSCKICFKYKYKEKIECSHSKVAILFSGGIDCSLIATLADQYVKATDSIDLINISFSNKNMKKTDDFRAPDEITAEETLKELKVLHPSRKWNSIFIKIGFDEIRNKLRSRIRDLIHPLKTVMDLDLGTAFWYAAQGKAKLENKLCLSTARVVLIGSGADELFGGYKRLRIAYCKNPCLSTLIFQFNLDWNRLPYRNMSRDERVISDHDVTPRLPFIEENFVQLVRSLSPLEKCCMEFRNGIGDKLILRKIAHQQGFINCSRKLKRAIQFGTRIADKNKNAMHNFIFFNKY